MKRIALIIMLLFPVVFARAEKTEITLDTAESKMSYALGVMIGRSIKQEFKGLDMRILAAAIADAYSDQNLSMDDNQVDQYMSELRQKVKEEKNKKTQAAKKEGEEFLAQNRIKKGVHVLENGVQYVILKKGSGPSPTQYSDVTVHYRGTLIDGTEFDSSYKRNEPIKFNVSRLIKGWTETLPLMKTGDKWRLFIPYELAYGSAGAGQDIPPYAALIFEIELLEVHSKPSGDQSYEEDVLSD